MGERWLSYDELCMELRLAPKHVKRLIRRGMIVGICFGHKNKYETDWRYLDPSPQYKKALGIQERILAQAYKADLLNLPILSSSDFGDICGLTTVHIRVLIYKKKLQPHKFGRYSLFTPMQVRDFLLRRERKEPTDRRVRCEYLIRWCKKMLEKDLAEAETQDQVKNDDELEVHLRRLLKLPEPGRAAAIREFWSRYELAKSVVKAIKG
jgi:hypothetical protein